MKKEIATLRNDSKNIFKAIDKVSSLIRSEIKEYHQPTSWPIQPDDLTNDTFAAPEKLRRFLAGLLTGDPDSNIQSHRVQLLIKSFGQDMMYGVSCGTLKPPKHFLLPYAVKSLTGNTELIKMLNRLGNGVSFFFFKLNPASL
jgi:hypothetical protein